MTTCATLLSLLAERKRHPLEDWLYYPLHDYRTAKACGMRVAEAKARKKCLHLIAMIKGRA